MEVELDHVMGLANLSMHTDQRTPGVEFNYEANKILLNSHKPGKPIANKLKISH